MTRFKHTKPVAGEHRFTVAGIIDGSTMRFGMSTCTPNDNFEYRHARVSSEGRARSKKAYVVPFGPEQQARANDVFHQTADALIEAKKNELYLREQAKKHK